MTSSKYRLRDEVQKDVHESSEPTSSSASVYGFAVGFTVGLLSALNILNIAMPLGVENTSLILSVLLISLFIINIFIMRRRESD